MITYIMLYASGGKFKEIYLLLILMQVQLEEATLMPCSLLSMAILQQFWDSGLMR